MIWKYFRRDADIRKRILTTLFVLAIFRLGAYIPAPGIDQLALREAMQAQGGLFGFINLLSGGVLVQFGILGLGILPYINAMQIVKLLVPLIPGLDRRVREDAREGRAYLDRLTIYLTIPVAMFSSYALLRYLTYTCAAGITSTAQPLLVSDSLGTTLLVVIVMTAGAMFTVFLGQQISEHGMRGQGVNLLIFSGIPVVLFGQAMRIANDPSPWVEAGIYVVFLVVGIFVTIMFIGARRNIPVTYASSLHYARRVGYHAPVTFLPVRMPLTFDAAEHAQGCLVFPGIVAGFLVCSSLPWLSSAAQAVAAFFSPEGWAFWLMLFCLAVWFTYFLTSVEYAETDYGKQLQVNQGFIPGVRPGAATQQYIARTAQRIALPAALYLGVLLILPYLIEITTGRAVPLIAGSTIYFLCVVVSDMYRWVEAEAKMTQYKSYLVK
jgi:preprotein translocase subunit SecY